MNYFSLSEKNITIFNCKVVYADTELDSGYKGVENVSVNLCSGIVEVKEGFLERIPTLQEISIPNTVEHIGVSQKFEKYLSQNDVLIRGVFDSYAEDFAKKYGLRFLHSEIHLGSLGDYRSPDGVDVLNVCFTKEGRAYIRQTCHSDHFNCHSDYTSQLSDGGEKRIDLPVDFLDALTLKEIAGMCWTRCSKLILGSDVFRQFWLKAKQRIGSLDHENLMIKYSRCN